MSIIKFWFKVVSSHDNRYIRQIYAMMLNDMVTHPLKQNWASRVKDFLSRLGFFEVRESQGVGNEELFLGIFKQRVRDVFTQDWH